MGIFAFIFLLYRCRVVRVGHRVRGSGPHAGLIQKTGGLPAFLIDFLAGRSTISGNSLCLRIANNPCFHRAF
jgi:hypothetical protein